MPNRHRAGWHQKSAYQIYCMSAPKEGRLSKREYDKKIFGEHWRSYYKKRKHRWDAYDEYCLHAPEEGRMSRYMYMKIYQIAPVSPYYKMMQNRKIANVLRGRIVQAIKAGRKSARTFELVGCSLEELKSHIEAKFHQDMTWENRGFRGWHIDHILPCDSFDLSDPGQQRKCFHYSNLQPLWWRDNLQKNAKLNWSRSPVSQEASK